MVAENLSHNSGTISPNSDSNMSDVLEFDPDAAAQRIEEEKRRIQNEINTGWKSNAAMVDKMPSQENLDNKDFEKLTEICLETQTVFLDSVACFGNATHLLYRQITGKESPRTPDSDGRIKDEFKIPMSSARAVSQNLPEGYSILDNDEARRMLTENDLLLETPLGGQISIYGDLIDNPMEGRDFQKISILDNNGIEREVRVETLGQNIEHTKTLLNQGIDLLLLRLQILNLDLAEQAENVFRIIIWLVVSGILLLIAFISLLFGLNRALSDTAAIWVFFGITVLSLIVIAILFGKVSKDWRSQNNQIAATLQDIRADIACLRGQDMQEGGDDE